VISSLRDIFTTSRSKILFQLESRPHTVSELSRTTGYSKPTLVYHLEKLCETGMVRRVENGRKWVYYELTEKGKRVIRQDTIKLVGLLVAGVASIVTSAYRFLATQRVPEVTMGAIEIERAPKSVESPGVLGTPIPAPTQTPTPAPTPTPMPTPTPTPIPTQTPTPKVIQTPTPELKATLPAIDPIALGLVIFGVVMLILFVIYRRK